MKLKTTKTLSMALNKILKNNNNFKNYNCELVKLTHQQLTMLVDANAYYTFKYDVDFDYKTERFNIFKITYPANFYANPKYLATCDLVKIAEKAKKPLTLENFFNSFLNEIEI